MSKLEGKVAIVTAIKNSMPPESQRALVSGAGAAPDGPGAGDVGATEAGEGAWATISRPPTTRASSSS